MTENIERVCIFLLMNLKHAVTITKMTWKFFEMTEKIFKNLDIGLKKFKQKVNQSMNKHFILKQLAQTVFNFEVKLE